MIEALKSFGTGAACGIVFALFRLPIPAPSVFNGILGIIGIFVGFMLIKTFILK